MIKKRVMIAQQIDQIKKKSVNCNQGKKYYCKKGFNFYFFLVFVNKA